MKGGSVAGLPVECWRPRLCVGVPLVVYSVALLNGGSGMCCDAPSSDWSGTLCCLASPCIVLPLLVLCVVGGEVRWCVVCGVWCLIVMVVSFCSSLPSFFVFAVTALLI